jgi:predicted acetyltransferase
MRDRGQSLSGLYTPHPAFYRRYAWEIAADERRYSFKPKDYRPSVEPSERGRLRYVEPQDWQELDRIYRRHSASLNGPLHRGEVWWRNSILNEAGVAGPGPAEAVVWETAAGESQGYCVFAQPTQGPDARKVVTRELAAATPDAYLNLMAFLALHDIHDEIVHVAPSSDPLPLLFADAERLEVKQGYTVLLRIVDVEAALKMRPLAHGDIQASFSLEVTDSSAPWNAGVYRLVASEGSVQVERVTGNADLRVDARVLAPVFNGYLPPSLAAATGQMAVVNPEALPRADEFFSVAHRPFFPDRF